MVQVCFIFQFFSAPGLIVVCSRNFILPNTNSYLQPWVLSLWWMWMFLLSPTQSLISSLLIGQEENEGFALPSTLHPGCVCHTSVLLCSAHVFPLSEVALAVRFLSDASPAEPPAQGRICLIHSLSVCQQGVRACPCTGTFVTRLRQELVALLIERGCLICRLSSSDSSELSVLMLHSLSFSPR